tara:strand:+ start:1313 stop:2170 length:858 start_codon:yes stop_codon:yes gene_type:complete
MVAQISYNCPVLGNDEDYQDDALFIIDQKVKRIIDSSGVKVIFPKPNINERILFDLFKNNEAKLILIVNSARSYFQKTYTIKFNDFNDQKYEIFFNYGDLNGDVIYQFFLISSCEKLISPSLISDDFPKSFYINKNDILAKTPEYNFLINHKFNPYSSKAYNFISVSSLMDENKKETEIDFSGLEKIVVRLNVETYERYKQFDDTTGPILHSSIVLAALTEAVNYIKLEKYSDHDWYLKINEMIKIKNLERESSIDIASALLKDPINRGMIYISEKLIKSKRSKK